MNVTKPVREQLLNLLLDAYSLIHFIFSVCCVSWFEYFFENGLEKDGVTELSSMNPVVEELSWVRETAL